MTVIINGMTFPSGKDIRIVNGQVFIDGVEVTKEYSKEMRIVWEGPAPQNLYVQGDNTRVECGDVGGEVVAKGSVSCKNVQGNVRAQGSVNCDGVGQGVEAGGSVNCNNVGGSANAGGSITCGDIAGSAKAGGSIRRS